MSAGVRVVRGEAIRRDPVWNIQLRISKFPQALYKHFI